jgi:hypothetical protein
MVASQPMRRDQAPPHFIPFTHEPHAMKRISSKMTFFYKRIFPVVMLGILLLIISLGALTSTRNANPPPAVFIFLVAAFIASVTFFVFRKLIFDLVDEVWDAGDALVVRNKGREERILLPNIINIGYTQFVNPPRVTLWLRTPSVFGDKVSFCPPVGFSPLSVSAIVDELVKRVDDARQRKR